MNNFLLQLVTLLTSKRVQALLGLLVVNWLLPRLHVSLDAATLQTVNLALKGWLLYGIVSAQNAALPGVGGILKAIFFKK